MRPYDKWIAYGDGILLKEESRDTLKIVKETVQTSVDQVYEAYSNPIKALDPSGVTELIPFIDLEDKNNAPLFLVKAGKIMIFQKRAKKTSDMEFHIGKQSRPLILYTNTRTCI